MRKIKVALNTSQAAVDDLGLVGRAVLAVDGNVLATQRVGVGVASRVGIENDVGNGNNLVTINAGLTTSTKTNIIPGDVSSVFSAGGGHASRNRSR